MKNWFPVVAFVLCTANVVRAQSIYEPYVFTIFPAAAPGSRDGIGNDARFDNPAGIAVDELAGVILRMV